MRPLKLERLLQNWLSEAELGATFDNYDADHSGDISFDEFEKMVRSFSLCFMRTCDHMFWATLHHEAASSLCTAQHATPLDLPVNTKFS